MERIGGGWPRRTMPGWRWLLAALCALVLAGCGGSGSSGFDGIAAENAAIDDALESGGCVTKRGLTICAASEDEIPVTPPTAPAPSATATPRAETTSSPTATPPVDTTGTPTETSGFPTATTTLPPASVTRTTTPALPSATPTPTHEASRPNVDIQPDPTDVANCAGSGDSQSCGLRLYFVPIAAPADAVYRAAVRSRDPDSDWRILEVSGTAVDVVIGPDIDVIQLAILLYERDPGPVPSEVKVLFDSGADFAFVAAPLLLRE